MTPEKFIEQCNKTPLFKVFRLERGKPFIIEDLQEFDFVKTEYKVEDLNNFAQLVTGVREPDFPEEINDLVIKDRGYRDLAHYKIATRLENMKYLQEARRKLGFPAEKIASGFKVENHRVHVLSSSLSNTDFSFSPPFKSWLFSHVTGRQFYDGFDEWQTATGIVFGKIRGAVREILTKWELPDRYDEAVEELLVFNRIIPASMGITWHSGRDAKGNWVEGIYYSPDITKAELIAEIKGDHLGIFRNKRKYLRGKTFRSPRKMEETKMLLNLYKKAKRVGTKDKEVFAALHHQYPSLSISAIRKRIKGK